MLNNIGLYSYLLGAVTFAVLTLLLLVSWRGRPFGMILIVASSLTCLWASVIGLGTTMEYPPLHWITLAEAARNTSWLFLLLKLTALRFDGDPNRLNGRQWRGGFLALAAATLATFFYLNHLDDQIAGGTSQSQNIAYSLWLMIAVLGLVLLEQIFRNATEGERWSIKFLCLGLGGMFGYDFLMYAEAALLGQLNPVLWQARGVVTALMAPLIAIAIARNPKWQLHLHVSRQVVFHSVTLLAGGIYLITMAIAGYFIRYLGGTWGGVIQVTFVAASAVFLLTVLFSGKVRAQTRVFLNKHFFSYKYDYREEWLKFTKALANIGEDTVPEGILKTMASLVGSPAGALWARNAGGGYSLLSHWEMPAPRATQGLPELSQWLADSQWVIDIEEYHNDTALYAPLALPRWLLDTPGAWLIIPLIFNEQVQGIVLLKDSQLRQELNWEDRDLLKTGGRQAASHLAQYLGSQALVEARQFEAFNRLSAYVIHDLKNILAQQSLIVKNAEKHKHNPDFVDDMIGTVNNSVGRMTSLMEQMRSGMREKASEPVDLSPLLAEAVSIRSVNKPTPLYEPPAGHVEVLADRDRLLTVFGHLIQNAQEASEKDGEVTVTLSSNDTSVIATVKDSGRGMDEEFVRNRLFKPFDSTKGLTGMGIGAFESREYIRSLGGDISVESAPERGSEFRIMIPLPAG